MVTAAAVVAADEAAVVDDAPVVAVEALGVASSPHASAASLTESP